MSCLAFEQLAAIAADEGEPGALAHAASCARCAALLDEQRAMRQLVRGLRPPALDGGHRAELAAEIMARADAAPHRRAQLAIGLGLGAAAAAAIVFVVRASTPPAAPIAAVEHEPPRIHVPDRAVASEPAPIDPETVRASIDPAVDADLTRDTTPERDLVTLRAGTLAVDASQSRPVQIKSGMTRVEIARARASVIARRGAIETVRVFAGSVEVIDGGKRHVIVAGATWERLSVPPANPSAAMAAFREGYTALRNGDHAAAITAFDRATDPVVLEDATFWAAVAAERGGRADAGRRFADFIARYPMSPRIEAARAAVARLDRQNMQR